MVSDVSDDGVSHTEAGRWLSIQEAAHHLAVSERTIYRRADRGQLRRQTLSDGRVEVWVPAEVESGDADGRHDVSRDTVGQERAVLLVDRVSAAVSRQLEALTVELAASRERIEALARENGILSERSATLERELTTVRHLSDADKECIAGLERVRDAAMAHAAELEAKLEAAAVRPPDTAEEVADLRAEHYRHTSELARADVTLAGQAASHAQVSRQARRLWIALAVAGALAVAAVVAPAWVR